MADPLNRIDGRAAAPGTVTWEQLCREFDISPDEVRLVFDRFDARRSFAAAGHGEPPDLAQWFQFYHLEKTSEGEQAGPAPSGCSIDSHAVNDACIRRPAQFLEVLRAYAAWKEATGTDPDP